MPLLRLPHFRGLNHISHQLSCRRQHLFGESPRFFSQNHHSLPSFPSFLFHLFLHLHFPYSNFSSHHHGTLSRFSEDSLQQRSSFGVVPLCLLHPFLHRPLLPPIEQIFNSISVSLPPFACSRSRARLCAQPLPFRISSLVDVVERNPIGGRRAGSSSRFLLGLGRRKD